MSDGFFPDYIDEKENNENNDIEQDDSIPFSNDDFEEWSVDELEEAAKGNIVNQKNEEEFQEVMENASKKYDTYWDRDNIVIKIILYVLFGFSGISVVFYIFWWIFSN